MDPYEYQTMRVLCRRVVNGRHLINMERTKIRHELVNRRILGHRRAFGCGVVVDRSNLIPISLYYKGYELQSFWVKLEPHGIF